MGVFGNEYITEGDREDTYKKIINNLSIFYQHVAKWVYVPNLQSASWANSIRTKSEVVADIDHPAYYKGFIISDHLDKIKKRVEKGLKDDGNDLRKFNLDFIYSYFDTLDKISDKAFLNEFLLKFRNNDKINIY